MRTALPLFMSLLLAAFAFGAEPTEPPPAEEAETEEPVSDEDIDAAMAEEIREAEAAAANAEPADANEPFIPTVQISEDLSVSFPVDI